MARSGFGFTVSEADELELAYIGGLLKLDLVQDTETLERGFEQLKGKRGPSPNRKG